MEALIILVLLVLKLAHDRGAEINAAKKAKELAEEREAKSGHR
ncbi:MAG: hypothetical protein PHP02_04010 [Eubacteriales bacterium]|nr:hypothetical protein [Eubacteriales bacterium]